MIKSISTSRPAALGIIAALALSIVFACGHGGSVRSLPAQGQYSGSNQPATGVNAAAASQGNQFPASLPTDKIQLWEKLGVDGKVLKDGAASGPGRAVAAINSGSDFTPGVERYNEAGDVTDMSEASSFASGSVGVKQVSYALYRITMGALQPGAISADVNLHPKSGGSESKYFLGISDYGNGTWKWLGSFSDPQVRLSIASGNYTSGIGNTFIAVVAYDGASFDVVGIGVNPKDDADTTAPPVPASPSLTPVPGGILVEWPDVVATDLAGYYLYTSGSSFSSKGDPGVKSVGYVLGQPRFLLETSAPVTFVSVSAIDISGNESAITAALSAAPLSGSVPDVTLATDTVSGRRNAIVTLTATGGTTYDFDTNGDGVFDTTNATGIVQADTSNTGIVRPAVRCTNAGGAVAFTAVSLIINSNSRPVASAQVAPSSGKAPLDVTFTGTGVDDDGTIAEYAWDYDGDGTYDEMIQSPPHQYIAEGLYNAKLRVIDDDGAWDVDTVGVQVYPADPPPNEPPFADFALTGQIGDAPFTVNFFAYGSNDPDGLIAEYAWDWDGHGTYDSFGAADTAQHSFATAGIFATTLRVTDNRGAADTVSASIRVNEVLTGPSAWWMYGHDQRHTHRSSYLGARTNQLKWLFPTGTSTACSPTIGADGTIYMGSGNGKLYAIYPNGNFRWSYTTGDMVYSSSAAIGADGAIYFGSYDSYLYALNSDSSLKWSYPTGAEVATSPVIGSDGTLNIGNNIGNMYWLYPDGSLKYGWDFADAVLGSPAIGADGTVYWGCDNDYLYAFSSDGAYKWRYLTGGNVSSPAIDVDGTIYVASTDGKLYAVNADGTQKWTYSAGEILYSPAIAADGTIYTCCENGNLYAINPDGSLKWTYPAGGSLAGSPAIDASGVVYLAASLTGVLAIKPGGTILWSFPLSIGFESSPAIGSDGTVYVSGSNGILYAFRH